MVIDYNKLHDLVIESVQRVLETAKIRPVQDTYVTVPGPNGPQRQSYMDYVNQNQVRPDFAKLKQNDDLYNYANNLTGDSRRKSGDSYSELKGYGKTYVNKLQRELGKAVQDRYMADTGKKAPVMRKSELGKLGKSSKLKDALKGGMELDIKGKTFAFGNSKLPENTMIVNLTSAWNCPSLQHNECPFGRICYARKGEKQYANTQLRNLRNQYAFKYLTTKEILKLVEAYIEHAPAQIEHIRISEDGDFPDQDTVDFCDKLAGHLKAKYGIITTAYTHRQLNYSGVKHMLINASDYRIQNPTRYFICTSPKDWAKLPDGLSFNPKLQIEGVDTSKPVFKCPCDCRQCGFCYKTKAENGEPDVPITVVEELRGGKSAIKTALAQQSKTSQLQLPACAPMINKETKKSKPRKKK